MFNDKNRAFYKSVKHLNIKEISLNNWQLFIVNKFLITDKKIDKKLIEICFKITLGYPYYMQQLMYYIWTNTAQTAANEIVKSSIKTMLEREDDIYSLVWTNLTPNQKITLKYIVATDGNNMYTHDNLSESNLSASTLKSTLEALIKKDICNKKNNSYYLIDPFMKYWLERI